MKTAKIFRSGNSQAVRIPKEFQKDGMRWKFQSGDLSTAPAKRSSWATIIELAEVHR